MERIRIKTALVGIGRWGKNHARELNLLSEFTAYASSTNKDCPDLQNLTPKAVHVDTRRIINDSTIDAVVIATPVSTHANLTEAMLEAGKHVLVEKPAAESSEEAFKLSQKASERGLVFATGYIFLYHPAYQAMKKIMRESKIEIDSVQCIWKKYGTFTEDIEYSLLTHHLSIAYDLFGFPKHATVRHGTGTESACDQIETTLEYETFSFNSDIDRSSSSASHTITVTFKDGGAMRWSGSQVHVQHTKDMNWHQVYESHETPLVIELQAFLRAVAQGPACATSGDFGARVLELHEMLTPTA